MTDLERAIVQMRDIWTLLAKADEMMEEEMDALELAISDDAGRAAPPTLLPGWGRDGNTESP